MNGRTGAGRGCTCTLPASLPNLEQKRWRRTARSIKKVLMNDRGEKHKRRRNYASAVSLCKTVAGAGGDRTVIVMINAFSPTADITSPALLS